MMNPNGGIGRFFSNSSNSDCVFHSRHAMSELRSRVGSSSCQLCRQRPISAPNSTEVLQIKQLQCEELVREFPSLSEDVIMMFLDEAYSKSFPDPLEKARSWLAEQVAEQNLHPLVPRDYGQPSGSMGPPPRSTETPPFQASNPFGFNDSSWQNESSWPSLPAGFASERTPAVPPTPPLAQSSRSKTETPDTEEEFYKVEAAEINLDRLEKETEGFIKEAKRKKEENDKLREKFRELYAKCRDPNLLEYMNLVDCEETLDKNIRNLQEVLKSMGVSSDNSDNVQTGK